MANERLRQAIDHAGLEPEQLADLVEVDIKTVQRWLAGVTPHPRRRARIARALGREQHELWPDVATAPPEDEDTSGEIQGAWAHADDPGIPDWRDLLEDAVAQVELLDYSLLDLLATDGVTDTLAAKAASGCRVRILISAPDSTWVSAAASSLDQDDDYIGRSELALEIETARGHLEPLTNDGGVELRQVYADPGQRILRFDEQMLISPHLYGTAIARAPLLHLWRRQDGGLFDQFAAHLQAIAHQASQPVEPAPELYPDPRTHPDRYKPLTADTYQQQLNDLRQRHQQHTAGSSRPLDEVRAELRRPSQPSEPATAESPDR